MRRPSRSWRGGLPSGDAGRSLARLHPPSPARAWKPGRASRSAAAPLTSGPSAGRAEDALNPLVLTPAGASHTATWWAGYCWDKAGQFTSAEAWNKYVADYARGLAAPIKVTIAAAK